MSIAAPTSARVVLAAGSSKEASRGEEGFKSQVKASQQQWRSPNREGHNARDAYLECGDAAGTRVVPRPTAPGGATCGIKSICVRNIGRSHPLTTSLLVQGLPPPLPPQQVSQVHHCCLWSTNTINTYTHTRGKRADSVDCCYFVAARSRAGRNRHNQQQQLTNQHGWVEKTCRCCRGGGGGGDGGMRRCSAGGGTEWYRCCGNRGGGWRVSHAGAARRHRVSG